MKYLFIAFLFISSFISGQGIEPTSLQPTQYQGGILRGVIPYVDEFTGETLYIYQHVDSLVFVKDSIFVRNDSIFLRDGTGFAIVTDSIYVVTGVSKDTIKLRDGDGYVVIDKADQARVRGTGTATRVAWWGGTDSLSSDAAFYWNNNDKRLGIGTTDPQRELHVAGRQFLTLGPSYNVFINGGNNTVTGIGNVGIGSNQTLANLTSGNNNFAMGNLSGFGLTNGSNNFFLGSLSGVLASSSTSNVFIGTESGYLATGSDNVFIGSGSGANAGISSNTVSIGSNTSYSDGGNNVNIGFYSGFSATGAYNVNIGRQAGQQSGSGGSNVYLGYAAGLANTGSYNVALGVQSGYSGDGDSNVFLGRLAGFSESGSNTLHITSGSTNGIFGNFLNGRFGINLAPSDIGRTFDINGELRIRDLVTTIPTKLVSTDNDGVISSTTIGNGLSLDGGSLTVTANINGTQNRVAKFTSQYAVGNSEIYTVGDTLVGINQSNPQYHLDVSGKFRVTQRTGTAATGAGFTSDGQLISYSLDTAEATPNTYIQSGSEINITGSGTMADPYTINNTAPENTTVKDGIHLDFSELSNDTITATIITGSIGPTELASTSVTAGSYTFMSGTIDADGRLTAASSGSAVTSIGTTSPITGGTITTTGSIGINDARANSTTKGASAFNINDFNDDGAGLISLDYTNGQAASGSTKGFLTSTDWNTFNSKVGGTGTATRIPFWSNSSTLSSSPNLYWSDLYNQLGIGTITPETYLQGSSTGIAIYNTTDPRFALSNNTTSWLTYFAGGNNYHLWNSTSGIVLSATTGSRVGVNNSNPSYSFDVNGDVRISNRTGTPQFNAAFDSNGKLVSTGLAPTTGTVTSVGLTAGTGISVSGSPVTSSGNITVTNTGVTSLNGLGGTMFLSTGNSGIYPNWSSSGTTLYYNLPSGSSGQVLKHNGTGWTAGTDNTGTQNLSLNTESAGSIYMDITGGSGIYFSQGTGIDLVRSASNVLTVNSTFTNTDNQTLTFISPTLSISNGNSVTLPVLPSGTTRQTLRNNGSSWVASSLLENDASRIDINGWVAALRTTILGSRLLVNGYIQYDPVGSQATTVAGRDANGGLTGVTVGSGLSLSGGTLTATDASTSNEIQTLSHSAPTLSISSGNSITLTQQYGQMSSNGGCATVSTSYGTTVSGTAIGNNVTVSSTTITVPATGTYELNYSGYFILDPTASNVGVGMRVRKNGSSTVSVTIENIQGTASTEYRAMSKNVIVSLNSGDTLVLQPTKDAGTVNLCDYVMNIIRLN
jgi:hypothetical protein